MAAEAVGEAADSWDETQYIAALAHYEQLQAHIDNLRLAIPRIIEPLHRPPGPATFKLYAQGALSSQDTVKALHEHWKDPTTQNIFEHTRQSYAENPDLSESRSIPSHGWREREKKERESKKSTRSDSTDDSTATLNDEDITHIVEDFQKTYPNIKLEMQDEPRLITTQFISQAQKLRLRINIEREANGRHKLNVECLGSIEPFLAITRCLASRPQANDLKYLLDMIAAYKIVKGTSCDECGKLLDNAMLTPTARRAKQVDTNEPAKTVWVARHESCLN